MSNTPSFIFLSAINVVSDCLLNIYYISHAWQLADLGKILMLGKIESKMKG